MDLIKNIYTPIDIPSGCTNCWLNNSSAFRSCSPEIRQKILLNRKVIKYSKKSYLIKSGNPVSGVFCIQKGTVKILKQGNKGKEFILWIARQGDMVGLNSFLNDEAYTFSATAIDEVSVCFIPAVDLKALLNKEPVVFVQFMRKLCDKLNFVEQRITSISRKSIKAQCAEILLSLSTQNNMDNDKKLYINYSIGDLASLIGTTKNYLYKVLVEFTDKDILSIRNRRLLITNLNALTLIAAGNDR